MKTLPFMAGVFILLLVLSTNALAESDLVFDCPEEPKEFTFDANKDFTVNWLDGKVCFEGGKRTADWEQYFYAKAHKLQFSLNPVQFWNMVNGQVLVHLKPHQEVPLRALFDTPFVLPETAEFTKNLAEAYRDVNCGNLDVTGGGRFKQFRNSSDFSVHPAGMAVDIRVRTLSNRCYENLVRFLYYAEADKVADTTRERRPPHFHVVVVPKPKIIVAKGSNAETSRDQGE